MLATASNAVVIGFQVRPSADARRLAEKEKIDIRLYSIIYDAIEELKSAMEGMLPPDIETLQKRLEKRGTDAPEVIAERIGKARYEIDHAPQFDLRIVNDDLPVAVAATESAISTFLHQPACRKAD